MDGDQPQIIPTNMRLVVVIEEIARAGLPVTPTEVNAKLGLPKPTIHRLFATLENEGFLKRDADGRTYSPGPRLRVLAGGTLSSLRIRTARQAILRRLSREIGETCNIALPDRDQMIYLERVETEWPLRIQLPQGSRVPLYCTASGKMYLSTLSSSHLRRYVASADLTPRTPNTLVDRDRLISDIASTRRRGYALDMEEFMTDMIAMAVPILDKDNRLMATLSFHAPTQRYDVIKAERHIISFKNTAAALAGLIADDS